MTESVSHRHGIIYRLRNKVSGKEYIGCTSRKNPYSRISSHIFCAKVGLKTAIAGAIRKHGFEKFEVEWLACAVLSDDLKSLEVLMIAQENTRAPIGYNMTDGGDGLINPTPETIKKIRRANTGKVHGPRSAETKAILSAQKKGKRPAQSTLDAASALRKGKKFGPLDSKTAEKISRSLKGKSWTDERRANHRRAIITSTPKSAATRRGKSLSQSHRESISKAHMGKPWSPLRRKAYLESKARATGKKP